MESVQQIYAVKVFIGLTRHYSLFSTLESSGLSTLETDSFPLSSLCLESFQSTASSLPSKAFVMHHFFNDFTVIAASMLFRAGETQRATMCGSASLIFPVSLFMMWFTKPFFVLCLNIGLERFTYTNVQGLQHRCHPSKSRNNNKVTI